MSENIQPKQKGDKTVMLASVAVLALLLLAGGYYWHVIVPGQNVPAQEDEQSAFEKRIANDPSAKEMFAAFDKQKNFSRNYYAAYNETLPDGSMQQVEIYSSPVLKFARIKNDIFEQGAYWQNESVYVCQSDFERKKQCAKAESAVALNIAKNLEMLFIGYDPVVRLDNEKLYRLNVLKFVGAPQEKNIAGRSCVSVKYNLDYSNLTEFQLTSFRISKTDPMLTVFGNFSTQRCFDSQTGLTTMRQLSYIVLLDNVSQTHKIEYALFNTPIKQEQQMAQINTDSPGLDAAIEKMDTLSQYLDDCVQAEGNLSKCILMDAVLEEDVSICSLIEDRMGRDRCSLRIVSLTNQPQLCEKTGDLKNECYLNYAYINKDVSYCSIISDMGMKAQCLGFFSSNDGSATQSGGYPSQKAIN